MEEHLIDSYRNSDGAKKLVSDAVGTQAKVSPGHMEPDPEKPLHISPVVIILSLFVRLLVYFGQILAKLPPAVDWNQ